MRRAAAVNAYTVPMFSFPILLGNDTGRWRGSNDLLEITVGNWLRALPAEIATGGTPAGGSGKYRLQTSRCENVSGDSPPGTARIL